MIDFHLLPFMERTRRQAAQGAIRLMFGLSNDDESKPGKYGMKIWILCDSDNSYCCNAQIYIGRVGARDIGQSHRVVMELTDHMSGSGRHLTADNFFTDITTVRTLLGRQNTYTGTLRKNKERYQLSC